MVLRAPANPDLHHRLTWKHLQVGSATRSQLEEFIGGQDLTCLPDLFKLVSEMRFLPVVERIQEGDHSIVNRMVQNRRVNGPYIACAIRMPEVKAILSSAEKYSSFLGKFEEISQPDHLAKRFGFWRHPLWQNACAEKFGKRKKMALVSSFLYSLDVESQYANLTSMKKAREKHAAKRKSIQEKWMAYFKPKRRFSEAAVERSAMASHLQTHLVIGRLYSVGSDVALPSLEQALKPAHMQAVLPLTDQGAMDSLLISDAHGVVQDELVDGDQPLETLFFRITCARPSRRKLVQLPAASSSRLGPEDLCVTIHPAWLVSSRWYVDAEPTKAEGVNTPIGILSACRANPDLLRESLTSWSTVKELSFVLAKGEASMNAQVMKLLQRFVQAKAFPCQNESTHEPRHLKLQLDSADSQFKDAAEALLNLKAIEVCSEGAEREWRLTLSGLQQLRHVHMSSVPTPVFRSPEALADLPSEDWVACSSWELFTLLKHHGWTLRQAPSTRARRQALMPHKLNADELVWFLPSTAVHPHWCYMLALLKSTSLFQSGDLEVLHHCQSKAYYTKVLERKHRGHVALPDKSLIDRPDPKLVLEIDVDPDAVPSPAGGDPVPAPRLNALPPHEEARSDWQSGFAGSTVCNGLFFVTNSVPVS